MTGVRVRQSSSKLVRPGIDASSPRTTLEKLRINATSSKIKATGTYTRLSYVFELIELVFGRHHAQYLTNKSLWYWFLDILFKGPSNFFIEFSQPFTQGRVEMVFYGYARPV